MKNRIDKRVLRHVVNADVFYEVTRERVKVYKVYEASCNKAARFRHHDDIGVNRHVNE